jgi:hypothetical protein
LRAQYFGDDFWVDVLEEQYGRGDMSELAALSRLSGDSRACSPTDGWSGSRPSEDNLLVGGFDAAVEQLPDVHWRLVHAVGKVKLRPTCAFEGTLPRTPVLFET